jgi:type II secretory pathway component GspD/PulD (secretin)
VGAASLAEAIRTILPDLKVTTGPIFLSPPLDNSGGSGGDAQVKALTATDISFKTHDVLFSGPAALVRRALSLAQKFDRPRKQVRIAIKIVSVTHSDSSQLGITWPATVTYSATEQSAQGSSAGALVDGIRLGKFSHTPLVVSATLNAMESKGKAKTLSNPTLMLLDGERAFILSGQKLLLPVFKGKDQNGQSIYDTAEYKIGIYLQVGVQIGLDNDMVLSLYPQVTAIQGYQTINGAQYPTINTSEEHTTVRASSGEVIVLGGMLKDATTSTKAGLPFLGHIPFLGKLFSEDNDTKDKEELMIILTPELVDETLPKTDVKMSVTTPAP